MCLYVADPATFSLQTVLRGPYIPLRTARLFSYGINKLYYYHIDIVNINTVFDLLHQNYVVPLLSSCKMVNMPQNNILPFFFCFFFLSFSV